MSDELTKNIKTPSIEINGKSYVMPLLNGNILTTIENELGCGLDGLRELFQSKQISTLRTLVWAILVDEYPELTIGEVGKAIKLKNLSEVSNKVFTVVELSLSEK
ncbi:MAG: hypothetical protein PHV11_08940 [Candidatus Bipolaricaulis sp.]|nr:hypothetical protein [Candidatus Bipolaricaulis sp.]